MSEYVLSCSSTADLTKEYLEKREIEYICFHYVLDGQDYLDDFGETIPLDEFYLKMQQGADTKTFQINADEYEKYFEKFLQQGKDILHLSLSSGISGTVNSAMIAKGMLEEKYPERKIYVVDSLAASSGYGLLMDKLADLREEGRTIDEVYQYAQEHKRELNHWFFSTDLTFFVKGGRVSKTAGFFGNMLNICPLLNVNHLGQLIPRAKIRSKRKAIVAAAEKMFELAKDGDQYCEKCFISNSACEDDAISLARLIEEHFPKLNGKVQIFPIGTTIGSHTGPGTVALFFWGSERVD